MAQRRSRQARGSGRDGNAPMPGRTSRSKRDRRRRGARTRPIAYLADAGEEPCRVLEAQEDGEHRGRGPANARWPRLDPRSRRIIEARWLAEKDAADAARPRRRVRVSAERIRQIEAKALQKMKRNRPRAAAPARSDGSATHGSSSRLFVQESSRMRKSCGDLVARRAAASRAAAAPAGRRRSVCAAVVDGVDPAPCLALLVEDLELLRHALRRCRVAAQAEEARIERRHVLGQELRRIALRIDGRRTAPARAPRPARASSAPFAMSASVVGQTSGQCVKPKKSTTTLPRKSASVRAWPLWSVRRSSVPSPRR